MNTTIGEIRKAIDDEFNDNVRRFMLSKHSEPRMTVKPQKRRTVRISNKWTELVKTRLPTPPKQMDSKEPVSQLRVKSSVFVFGTAATACRKGKTRNSKMRILMSVQMRHNQRSVNDQRNAEGANRPQWYSIKYSYKVSHRITITNQRHHHELRGGRSSPNSQIKVSNNPQKKSSD